MALDFKLSSAIAEQLPAFVQNEYPTFVSFLENYYEYLEKIGQPNEIILNLSKYNDIDLTQETFIKYFLTYYAHDIPKNAQLDERVLIKILSELYNRKGSEKAIKMLFRILYDIEAVVDYPFEYVLRSSGAHWNAPVSIKIRPGEGDIFKLIGTTITGASSGATGFVVDAISYILVREQVYELFLDRKSLTGTFLERELITGSYSSTNSVLLIESIYNDIYDRDPTEAEYNTVLGDIEDGSTLAEVIESLLNTSAVTTLPNVEFINKVYYAATGTIATPDQLYYEHTRITQGIEKSKIINDILKTIASIKYLKNYSLDRNSITVEGIIIPVISGITINDGGRNYSVGDRVTVTTNLGRAFGIVTDLNYDLVYDYSDYELLSESSDVLVDESGEIIGQEIDKSTATLPKDSEVLLEDGNVLLHTGNTSIILESILFKPSNAIVKIEMIDCFALADVYEDIKDFEILQENYVKLYLEDTSVTNASITLETPIADFVKDFEILSETSDNIVAEDGYSSVIQEQTYSTAFTIASTLGIRSDLSIESGPMCRYLGDWKNFQSRISLVNVGTVTPGRYDTGFDTVIRRRLIERVFYYAMNRTPTSSEYSDYDNKLLLTQDIPLLVSEITNLPEANGSGKPLNSNTQYVTGLYQICLDRKPEAAGLIYWRDRLKSNNYNTFILNTYSFLTGRLPSADNSSFWAEFIGEGDTVIDKMKLFVKQLATSQESEFFLTDNNNFINAMYKTTLGRNPLESERNNYFVKLFQGISRFNVVLDVLDQLECREYFNNFITRTTREQIALEIASSEEGRDYLSQFDYIKASIKEPVYYSPFSYNILSSEPKIKWDKTVKDLVHPAGLVSFGRTKVMVKNSV